MYSITVTLQLSGLTVMANHPGMHKIPIIGLFFENRLHCYFEVGKNFYKQLF